MNFSKYHIRKTLDNITNGGSRDVGRQMVSIKTGAVILAVLIACAVMGLGSGVLIGIIKNSPDINTLTFSPTGYASKAYDADGNLIATLVQEGSNREPVTYEEVPENLVNAVVAIEDQRFWEHDGIDLRSITRAVKGVLTGKSSDGGGSTITQQLIKNNVFGGGNEKGLALYERKFQEWYIALSLENQPGKDKEEIKKQIITDYLNTINLGNNTLGVKVAARRYFNKDIKDLTLAECTVLASIPKSPSGYNPITKPEKNQKRRLQVLDNMVEQGYITKEEAKKASGLEVYEEIKKVNEDSALKAKQVYSYFTDELINQVIITLKEELELTDKQAKDMLYSGGLKIYSTQDPAIQKIVDEEVNNPDNYDTAKYSFKWRFSVKHEDGSLTHYNEKHVDKFMKEQLSSYDGLAKEKATIEGWIEAYKKTVLKDKDETIAETLDFTLEPQLSFVVMDQKTKEVKAVCGGRGEKEYSLTINRATNTYRQPGSAFKVITAFAPAIDEYGKSLSTVYYDASYGVGEKEFRNWWSSYDYFGYSNIREGIEFSMNIVAVRCLMESVGTENGLSYARKLGITSLSESDNNAALALGGITKGVTNLELTNAYATIADGGNYGKYKFFTVIKDMKGNVIIDLTKNDSKRVMRETTSYLLTDAMRMSTVAHTKWAVDYSVNNTSSRSRLDEMVVAGKSGTTTGNKDIWFVGFTPYYTAGVWAGCDDNQSLYDKSTGIYNGGTSFHKDIWKKIMTRIHADMEPVKSFEKPENIVETTICRKSGMLAGENCRKDIRSGSDPVYIEYFDIYNVPNETCTLHDENGRIVLPEAEAARGMTDDVKANAVREAEIKQEEETAEAENEQTGPGQGPGYGPGYGPGMGPGSTSISNGPGSQMAPGEYESSYDQGNVR
ncbi:MAG: transglycosylase domain-containing protein [Eubacteriales bacterium]|nr:transglycosylase domain-containing protein [Eubacteriales bacterium]